MWCREHGDRGSAMQAGDIILFSSNGSYSGVHHVGIYIRGGNHMGAMPLKWVNQVTGCNIRKWLLAREFYQQEDVIKGMRGIAF